MPLNKQPLIHHYQHGKLMFDGLRGAWPFYEGSGTSVRNVSRLDGRDGTWAGTGSRWTSIDGGFAGTFNGSDDTVSIPNSDGIFSFGNSEAHGFTLAARVSSTNNAAMYIIDNRITTADGYIFLVNGGNLTFTIEGTATVSAVSAFTFDGLIHSVVATSDSGSGIAIYIDGKQVATNTAAGVISISSEQSVYIGSDGGSATFWNGTIGDVRIYNKVWGNTEAQLYHAGLG